MPPELPLEAWLLATEQPGVGLPEAPEGTFPGGQVLADLQWLRQALVAAPKPDLPPGLMDRLRGALNSPDLRPLPEPEVSLGVAPYLLGHADDDLEEDEWDRIQAPFVDEASSQVALAQLGALPELLREVGGPVALPAGLFDRIRSSLAEEALPPRAPALRWPEALDEGDAPPPPWVDRWLAGEAPQGLAEATAHAELAYLQDHLGTGLKPMMPADLGRRIHSALAHEPGGKGLPQATPVLAVIQPKAPWWKRSTVSALAGGLAAAFGVWWLGPVLTDRSLPVIETAAVSVRSDVAVNIGFDVERDVEGVTFQIDLPEGLRFLDDKRQPLLAQSVSWRGSLKAGRTVVPIHVQGLRPGRYEIEAFVRKGSMMRKTTILLPVQGPEGGA